MKPYIIRPGDHLARLAYQRGFDAEAVWSDPANAEIRSSSAHPDMLQPGAVLWLPPEQRAWHPVQLGEDNVFVGNVPTVSIHAEVVHADAPLARARYRVRELPDLGSLMTDEDGCVQFEAPVTLALATVEFDDPPLRLTLRVGHLDPAESGSGVRQRLRNLGYLSSPYADGRDFAGAVAMFQLGVPDAEPDGLPTAATRAALARAHGC